MVVCTLVYGFLFSMFLVNKKTKLFQKLQKDQKKKIFMILLVSNVLATTFFAAEFLEILPENQLVRNSYGEGSKTETYEATIEGALDAEPIDIEVQERVYTSDEIQKMFGEVINRLDRIVLGENKSRDRVETKLNLVRSLDGYPVDIDWEWDNYKLLSPDGEIREEATEELGTLLELKATISYGEEETVYVTNVMIYPKTKTGKDKWLDAIQKSVVKTEESTREEEGFSLPSNVLGKEIVWKKKKDTKGYVILACGVLICGILVWGKRQEEKETRQKAVEQMIRDYPDILSKFTLLLSTGMTVQAVWIKIVQGYEREKEKVGIRHAYEEMLVACHEMQSGVAEAEAYERFGRRCGVAQYMKLGALLSQNLKKGGKGLGELLKLESIQAFETRKSVARRVGEEASTKLLVPMFGMLAVVMIIVIIPAFLSIQI